MAEWREIRAVLDVSPQRGREGSARGFNPGNTVPRRRALKGRQLKRIRISRPFRANHLFGWFPGLKPWAEIGVGTKVRFAPPSEPDWQISCIRLSSGWLTFKKIGKPQRALVLRITSQLRRSRYLAIGVDRFHWPGLFVWFGV